MAKNRPKWKWSSVILKLTIILGRKMSKNTDESVELETLSACEYATWLTGIQHHCYNLYTSHVNGRLLQYNIALELVHAQAIETFSSPVLLLYSGSSSQSQSRTTALPSHNECITLIKLCILHWWIIAYPQQIITCNCTLTRISINCSFQLIFYYYIATIIIVTWRLRFSAFHPKHINHKLRHHMIWFHESCHRRYLGNVNVNV